MKRWAVAVAATIFGVGLLVTSAGGTESHPFRNAGKVASDSMHGAADTVDVGIRVAQNSS